MVSKISYHMKCQHKCSLRAKSFPSCF